MSATGKAAERLDAGGEGEFVFTPKDFATIAAILHEQTGIHLPPTKSTFVYSRLAKRLRGLGLQSFRDYCALVGGEGGAAELRQMCSSLTTNVTRFYREPHHFEHLKTRVLPALVERAQKGGRVRLWSAACSSGEEPYSMALTLLSICPEAERLDIRILATDFNEDRLAEGRAGVYRAADIEPVPADLRKRWFAPASHDPSLFEAAAALKALVAFRALNLVGPWPMRATYDAVFCRNVVIYFDDRTQAELWARIQATLAPGACLYIGHSERLSGPAAAAFSTEGITTYRHRGGRTA